MTWITLFGEILGKQARAAQINNNMAAALTQIQSQVPTGASKPKILYFESVLDSLNVAGTETYEDYYYGLVGAENAAASVTGMPAVDAEQIIDWDPDIILVGNFDAAVPSTITYPRPDPGHHSRSRLPPRKQLHARRDRVPLRTARLAIRCPGER